MNVMKRQMPRLDAEASFDMMKQVSTNMDRIKYAVWQYEQDCRGKQYLEAYIEFRNGIRMSAVRKMISQDARCEKRLGAPEEARRYCMKEAGQIRGPYEFGMLREANVSGEKDRSKRVEETEVVGRSAMAERKTEAEAREKIETTTATEAAEATERKAKTEVEVEVEVEKIRRMMVMEGLTPGDIFDQDYLLWSRH